MALLLQQRRQIGLQAGQFALGGADFVMPAGGDDDAGGIFRLLAERRHVGGDAAQRAHEHVVEREIDQRRGDAGDQQRQQEDVDRKAQHGVAQRLLVEHDFDELAAHRRRPDHPHHVDVAAQQGLERIDDGAMPGHVAHVDVVMDRRRHLGDRQQPALLAHLHRDRARADRVEDLARQILRHHAARRRVQHERRRIGGGQPVVQPVGAEIGDRRDIDQHFGDHHEQDRENEKLARKPEAQPATAGRFFRRRSICHASVSATSVLGLALYPNRRSQTTMRRNQVLRKRGMK